MENIAKNNRLHYKATAVKFQDDDYETPDIVLKDLLPYIPEGVIYDPFYCKGTIIEEWKKLDKICINEKKDAFEWQPDNFALVVSNIPFSIKEKCVKLCLDFDKPFALLMPIDALGSKWIKKVFDKCEKYNGQYTNKTDVENDRDGWYVDLEFIIPSGRYNFLKNKEKTKGAWFDTMWVCYKLDLPNNIIKL